MASEQQEMDEVEAQEVEVVAQADSGEDDDDEDEPVVAAVEVPEGGDDEHPDDDDSLLDYQMEHAEHCNIDEDEDELTIKSQATEDGASQSSQQKASKDSTPETDKKRPARRESLGSAAKKSRSPSVKGLTIPFRTVKKAMKLDPDIPIVQNEAAIMATMAAELFLKKLAKESFRNAKNRGRNTIRYEDVAEARTNDSALSFLETLLP